MKILRLDDACPYIDIEKWNRIERLCDKYGIKPLVGIIPDCKDRELLSYEYDSHFWTTRVKKWKEKGWSFALHGYDHVFITNCSGINPVNNKSEFAGVSYDKQFEKLKNGYQILNQNGIKPLAFFAPAHTFDLNTLKALEKATDIRIISDTPANKIYSKYGFTFVPLQSNLVRKLPFKVVTYCYHPNTMSDKDFVILEEFLKKHIFSPFPTCTTSKRKSFVDWLVCKLYFMRKK